MKRDGVLLIDKPPGITSRQAVSKIKSLTGVKKAGHTGTLDPLATGLLLVCLGRATLLSRLLSEGVKRYWVQAILGVETDTLDTDGTIIRESGPVTVSLEMIEDAVRSFTGSIEQVPPGYSAVKYHGKPLYSYARKGIKVDVEPRNIKIDRINLVSVNNKEDDFRVELDVYCSPGTYIRSLVSDIGTALGCGACVSGLRRLQSGEFSIENAVGLEHLLSGEVNIDERILSIENASSHILSVEVSKPGERGILCGKPLDRGWVKQGIEAIVPEQIVRVVSEEGKVLALYRGIESGEEQDIVAKALRIISISDEEVNKDEVA